MLFTSKPSLGKEELNRINEVFNSGWLGMGSMVFQFETKLKEFLNAKYVIAVNTGTSALHLALDSIGLCPADEVIVPSLTFAGSVQAIMLSGAKPVFCDIEKDTLNMDTNDLRKRITRKTRAIMPVHYGGLPCDMDKILQITHKAKIIVIEDAAHAFGSVYKGKKIGSFGDITCFSFDPIKNITCAEGGAVITKNKSIANKVIKKRILGIDKDTWHRYRNSRNWLYKVTTSGFRYHMSNINAAIGIEQLKKIDEFMRKKRQIAFRYEDALKNINGLELLKRDYLTIAPFNYVIKVRKNRDAFMHFLKKKGIETGVHYIPNHLQPFFAKYKVKLPVTEKVWKEIVTLPFYYDMSDLDVSLVIQAIKDFFEQK